MIFENIMNKVKDLEEDKIDIAEKIYLEEIKLEHRPSYYEHLLFNNIICWFDDLVIKVLASADNGYVFIKNNKKEKEVREKYPDVKVILLSDVIPAEKRSIITEYIRLKGYSTSLYRLLYRHLYNDKENFKVVKDEYFEGYVVFEVKPLTESVSNFRNRYNNKNYFEINESTDLLFKKIQFATAKYKNFKETGVLACNGKTEFDFSDNSFVSELTLCEIELYKLFIKELDFFVLTRNIIYNEDKLYVLKRNKDRETVKVEGICKITIEDVVAMSLKNTNISSVLDIDKYVYICWLIALDHFNNQRMNYNIIEENDEYIRIKSFL